MAKSLVITKVEVEAASASLAIEANFSKWLEILNRDLPLLITAMRYHLDDRSYEVPECNDIGRFCPIYVLCEGEIMGPILRFAANTAAYQLGPFCSVSCDTQAVEAFCDGTEEVDTPRVLLERATVLLRSGERSLACILACIASETVLTAFVRQQLVNHGLAKSKEKDAFNDLIFSQMLNLLSYFILDMRNDSTKAAIGKINALRKLRNDIVHRGKWLTMESRHVVEDGIQALLQIRSAINARQGLVQDGTSAQASPEQSPDEVPFEVKRMGENEMADGRRLTHGVVTLRKSADLDHRIACITKLLDMAEGKGNHLDSLRQRNLVVSLAMFAGMFGFAVQVGTRAAPWWFGALVVTMIIFWFADRNLDRYNNGWQHTRGKIVRALETVINDADKDVSFPRYDWKAERHAKWYGLKSLLQLSLVVASVMALLLSLIVPASFSGKGIP